MSLCYPGRLSLFWFLVPISTIVILIVEYLSEGPSIGTITLSHHFWTFIFGLYLVIFIIINLTHTNYDFQIALRASFLGCSFTAGFYIIVFSSLLYQKAGYYICLLSFFHYSEFLAIAWCNPDTLSITSFVLYQSPQYIAALIASWIEFSVEVYFFPELKLYEGLSQFGLTLGLSGEFIRKLAMITAATNFNHHVLTEKEKNHRLVTNGIYSVCRHPSYVGWFIWSIGTQILLLNPVCFLAYTVVSWRFFYERIFIEEQFLLNFFGMEYVLYQEKVGTGIPFIKGFIVNKDN